VPIREEHAAHVRSRAGAAPEPSTVRRHGYPSRGHAECVLARHAIRDARRKRFGRLFRGPIEKHADTARSRVLAERIRPFVLRRTKDRKSAVDAFQNGDVPVFLISLKAGGTGLNLTAADTVIHYDPWWNPAVERQATDRAHRIGQRQHVFVYKLIGAGTVEEKIVALQSRKAELAAAIFDGDGASGARFAAEDIERFFAPLET
jgi:SNF2 family DNA or RNA helicase